MEADCPNARVYSILSTTPARDCSTTSSCSARLFEGHVSREKPPSGRLAQEDADVHKLFLATQFRERLLDLDDGDDGPTTREAVANRVLEASTRCTSLERKEKVRKSIQRQLTSVGLDLMGRTGDVSETGTTNRNAVRPSEAIENEEDCF